MSAVATVSKTIESYEMRIARIADVDLDQLHALSIAVGWPHRAEDWALLRRIGDGFVALDEIDRIAGSVMWFPYGQDFGHLGMLITSPRLQSGGTGRWLMQHAFAELEGRSLALISTRASRRLLRSCGFQPDRVVYQCQGTVRDPAIVRDGLVGRVLRPLAPIDHAAVVALDAEAFGAARPALIENLLAQSEGFGLFRDETLLAFSLCRRFGRGHVVGPMVAADDDEAITVCAPHVTRHAGRFLRLDTHMASGPFVHFLSEAGLAVYDTVLAMRIIADGRDEPARSGGAVLSYALASQALA